MSDTNTGGPAFPFEYHNQTRTYQPGFFGTPDLAPNASQQFAGMSLRDYFAAKAMNGMCFGAPIPQKNELNQIAKRSYEMADAMLKAREK